MTANPSSPSLTGIRESSCPGCGLRVPAFGSTPHQGSYNVSPECWAVYSDVLGEELQNAAAYGQIHQLTLDTYAVQHAGGRHPLKSIAAHLTGLHLVVDRGVHPTEVPKLLHRLSEKVGTWPHFPAPKNRGRRTVCDVALSTSVEEHIQTVREWANVVWAAWSPRHADVARFAQEHLELDKHP